VDDTTNPKDTATFCSDAGAYLFQAFYNTGSGGRLYDMNGSVLVSVDEAYAHVTMILLDSNLEPFMAIVMRDDESGTSAFIDLVDAGDTYQSYFACVRLDEVIGSQTWGYDPWDAKATFRDSTGTIIENARWTANTGVLSRSYEDTNSDYHREYVKLAAAVGSYPQGVKGILSADTHHVIRADAQRCNQTGENKEWLHAANGHCFAWDADEPVR
jgi:hypothetical protein